ncbi:MAG: hypothetical protein KJP16_05670 [Gammaproteobacteria bacterium]|nr:hypothetical protein [Gammaproteobacteria bacterium]NNL50290.1 hypothetical protein [Woeseiaceae bacterium]
MNRSLIALAAALLLVATAYAESDQENKPRREHRGPPEAALEACSSSVQGDPCSFEGRLGEALDGTCEAPSDRSLACRPDRNPPEAALEACSSSVQGDPCSFEGRRGDALDGTCEAPNDRPLACRPDRDAPKQGLERE